MTRFRHVVAALKVVLLNVVIALVLLECSLQYVKSVGDSHSALVSKLYGYIKQHVSWEEYFVYHYMDMGDLVYAGIHQSHPTRGWAMKPSRSFTDASGISYTTNAQGYRALYDYQDKVDQYQVLIVGDSFTFGDDITDQDTWPNILQRKSQTLNVLEMAGTGYGTDQMLITLQEEIDKYHPDLVIAAFIDDNLYRSTLAFRDYKKPRFALENGQLKLGNTPIGDPYEVLQEISAKRYFSYGFFQTINLMDFFISDLTKMDDHPDCDADCTALNTAIFDKMQEISRSHGAEFMMVYLPIGDEIVSADGVNFGEQFFGDYREGKSGYFYNPRREFVAATFEKSSAHYDKNETALLADLVMAQIAKTASWQCKSEHHCF